MDYNKNDTVELVKDVAPFYRGDTVQILDVHESAKTYDICGAKSMEIWVKNVPEECMKGVNKDELV